MAQLTNSGAFWLYCAVIVLAPLPLGSVSPIALTVATIALGVAVAGLLLADLRSAQVGLLAALVAFAALTLWTLGEQLAWVQWPHSAPDPLMQDAAKLLGRDTPPGGSVVTGQPFYAMGLGAVGFLALSGGILVGGDHRLARQVVSVAAASGLVYAITALASFAIEPSHVLLVYEKQAHLTSLTSPFINRNTAGIYYGCSALIWQVLFCEVIDRHWPEDRFRFASLLRRLHKKAGSRPTVLLACWLTTLSAMFLTGSRGAVLVSLVAAVAAFVLFFHRRLPRYYGVAIAGSAGLAIALALLSLLGGGVSSRFSAQGLSDEGRLSTYRATWKMALDHAWLGSGFGTFEWLYPAYRTDDISLMGTWNRAHNSLLELASNGGMLMLGAAIIVLIGGGTILTLGVFRRRRDVIFPVVGLCTLGAAVLHSTIDFSLQIPGFTIFATALVGVGLAQSFRSGAASAPSPDGPTRHRHRA